jgi:RNA polymerase sigma-70 factor (ECF subfamily)
MSRSSGGARARATAVPSGASAEDASCPVASAAAVDRGHLAWLVEALRRRLGGDLAEDLAQEAWLRLFRGTQPVRNPRALLMTVAMNLARDQFRRDRVRAEHLEHSPDRVLQEVGLAATAEDDLHLKQVILSLPPKLRDVLLLSRIGGLTNREIAQRFGLSVRAVDKRLHRAIMLFVARLRD